MISGEPPIIWSRLLPLPLLRTPDPAGRVDLRALPDLTDLLESPDHPDLAVLQALPGLAGLLVLLALQAHLDLRVLLVRV